MWDATTKVGLVSGVDERCRGGCRRGRGCGETVEFAGEREDYGINSELQS